ncbi:unnamed protein product, partial [Amoebophrya sp. A120]
MFRFDVLFLKQYLLSRFFSVFAVTITEYKFEVISNRSLKKLVARQDLTTRKSGKRVARDDGSFSSGLRGALIVSSQEESAASPRFPVGTSRLRSRQRSSSCRISRRFSPRLQSVRTTLSALPWPRITLRLRIILRLHGGVRRPRRSRGNGAMAAATPSP